MAPGGNDVIESSNDDATVDRKLTDESRDQEASSAVNDCKRNDKSKYNDGLSVDSRSSVANRSVLDSHNSSSTATDSEQPHTCTICLILYLRITSTFARHCSGFI